MSKEMLINVSEGEECRIALVENGRLEELYMERTSSTSHVGNIYKGRVTNVEPSIQAAFVDFGLGRNGFLHISDLMPQYFGRDGSDFQETVGRKMARRDRPPIQRCLRRGDEIIVQIIKEGIGTKGPTLTSYISIPGRILVMMPGMGKMGVSKKIEDDAERRRLRTILDGLKPPKGVAFIIRTAGIGKAKTEIERDLKYLTRLWETIEKKQQEPGPVELYTEGDLVTRTVRDVFTSDVERIVIDSKDVAKRVKDVIKITAPRTKNKVDVYEDPVPLFHQYGIEKDIELMYSRHVPLPSGGSLVIDSTEAIVAIDVNSGKNRDHSDAETTAFRVDMEAADEICRQLKLRDLGGVIICDFIDLRYERHRRELEKRLDDNFRRDRAKTKVLRMSQFGIIEMTRQRMRPSLKRSVYFDCPHCKGAGLVKTPESMALDVMRKLAIAASDLKVERVEMSACPDVAFYLLNKKRRALADLEERLGKKILIKSDASLGLDELRLSLFDARDGMVVLEELGMTLPQVGHVTQLGSRGGGGRNDGRRGGGGGGPRRDDRNNRGGPPAQRGTAPARATNARDDDDEEDDDARFARETAEEAQQGDDEDVPTPAVAARAPSRGGRAPVPATVVDDDDDEDQDDEAEAGVEDADDASDEGAEAEGQSAASSDDDDDDAEGDDATRDEGAPAATNDRGQPAGAGQPGEGGGGSRRRRRRRGRRGRGGAGGQADANAPAGDAPQGDDRDAERSPDDRQGNRQGGQQGGQQGGRQGAGGRPAVGQNKPQHSGGGGGGGGGGGRQQGRNDRPQGGRNDRSQQNDRNDRNVPAYDRGRRADGSFENVTELETVDFGDEDDGPQPMSNERPPTKPAGRGGRGGGRGGPRNERQQPNRNAPVRRPPAPPAPALPTGPSHEDDDAHEPHDPNGNVVPAGERPQGPAPAAGDGAGGGADAGGDQPRRKRRRRGGRRHRRRRDNQLAREGDAPGVGPTSPNDGGDAIASADRIDDEADDREDDDIEDADDAVAEVRVPAQDPASSTSRSSAVRRPSPPPAPLPVVRTGSTDKHLVADDEDDAGDEEAEAEVVEAESTPAPTRKRASSRKPASFTDLDAIPDDYD